ncbi:MAG: hypothetical protein U0559_05420 [Anaerolineae bacterium]
MADESGEDLGPEFGEVVGRLEKGEDLESIEKSMPELGEMRAAQIAPCRMIFRPVVISRVVW